MTLESNRSHDLHCGSMDFATMSGRTMIIAEAGVNHNGDPGLAAELVEAAASVGADAVKFQSFKADLVVRKGTPKAVYQEQASTAQSDQHELLHKLELSEDELHSLKHLADDKGVEFMSTPFDVESARYLANEIGVGRIKVPSGEVTNGPLLFEVAKLGLPLVVSTGMCDLDDVECALMVLAHGLMHKTGAPNQASMESIEGRNLLKEHVTLLHCTTQYPAPYADTNLRAMETLAKRFGLPVGFSDHTPDIFIAIAAAAREACIVEKHFTLDRTMDGPDHASSLEVPDLERMIQGIRAAEVALGSGNKELAPSETENVKLVRRSLVAAKAIKRGEAFSADNVAAKRPGTGVSPMRFWQIDGTLADRDYTVDEAIVL